MADHADPIANSKTSLERIKKQLASSSRCLLQGPLLKRSETLRKWNQRWFTLDPATGKMEYRIQRGDISPKGFISLDAGSSVILSPINLQGSVKYDGCCIYIQNSAKKEYFLCAETPGAARAWVSTLQAALLVLKAHKDAVSSLGENAPSTLGTVAAVVAAANATAKDAMKEISAALQSSVKLNSTDASDGVMDNLSIMKETLKVKDEELHQMAKDMHAKDATIKDLAERLSETAEAAEAAASAAHIMDKERKALKSEIAKLRKELNERLQSSSLVLESMEGKLLAAEKARDEALKEAHLWRGELAKAREHAVVMEAALTRATTATESKAKANLESEAIKSVASEEETPAKAENELGDVIMNNEETVNLELSAPGSTEAAQDLGTVENIASLKTEVPAAAAISGPESVNLKDGTTDIS